MKGTYLVLLLLLLFPRSAEANLSFETHSQIIVLVPGMTYEEAEWYAEFGEDSFWSRSYMSAMNTKSADVHSDFGSMLTLASGRRAVGITGWQSLQMSEQVGHIQAVDLYKQLTGRDPQASILHPRIGELDKNNQQTLYRASIGQLGERLKKGNINRYVMGTSDTDTSHRFAGVLAMKRDGTVNGDVLNTVQKDANYAYGLKMDTAQIFERLNQSSEESRFIVIEWGDLYRLFTLKEQMDESHYLKQRDIYLRELESFMIQLRSQTPDNIWLISPFVHRQAYQNKQQLAPVYHWTNTGQGGFLYSDTTKREDVMSNLDLVPTFIKQLGLAASPYDVGYALNTVDFPSDSSLESVKQVKQMVGVFKTRSFVLSTYVSCLALLLVIVGCMTWMTSKRNKYQSIVQMILLSALSSPLWFLVLAGFETKVGSVGFLVLLLFCSLLWGPVFKRLGDNGLYSTALTTIAALNLDTLTGWTLISHSYLGYDPIIGARYYGIGNEYVGVFISFILLFVAWTSRVTNRVVKYTVLSALWGTQLLILGHPHLGANAGGFLSAAMAMGYWIVLETKVRLNRRVLLIMFSTAGVCALFLLFIMQLFGSEFSHIGKAYERLWQGDVSFIVDTILRKLEMNIKLFKHSNWTQLLVTSYILAAIILWWKKEPFKDLGKQQFIKIGTVCSIFLLFINDSGVVAAAISMFCVVATYFYWIQTEERSH